MRSVRPTTNFFYPFFLLIAILIFRQSASSQDNSPYSRYGLGNTLPGQNIMNRGMGGLASAYADYNTVNFTNPASYAELKVTSFDIGLDYTSRTLRGTNPPRRYTSNNLVPSYFQLGLPLSKTKLWGMNIGLRPVTRINYDILIKTRMQNVDSVNYNYSGTGGTYQAFTGFAYGNKIFNIGFNVGYMFGSKEYSTRLSFINDTVFYKATNSSDSTRFGGLFINGGVQFKFKLANKVTMRLGAHGELKSQMRAVRNITRQTIDYSATNGTSVIDSIYKGDNELGTIIYPATWGAGLIFQHETDWMFGAEVNYGRWSDYRYFGVTDNLVNNWTIRLGGQIIPNYQSESYWSRVAYRFGASFGPDNINLNKKVPQYSFSLGAGLPVRRNVYTNQYTLINTSFEFGFRGNRENDLRENLFKLSLGLNLGDIWFNKPKYQ